MLVLLSSWKIIDRVNSSIYVSCTQGAGTRNPPEEPRSVREGTFIPGGGLEIPFSYHLFGPREKN